MNPNKKQTDALAYLAKQLPPSTYQAYEKSLIPAKALTKEECKNLAIEDKESVALQNKPFVRAEVKNLKVNHKRRLKRAFTRGGVEDVWLYVKRFVQPEKTDEAHELVMAMKLL